MLSIYRYILYFLFILLISFCIYLSIKIINKETFIDGKCPTTMIKDGDRILIYDPKKAKVPGVNPIILNNLEEYKEFVKWQNKNNLNCPILFLEKSFDVQGNEMYDIKPNRNIDIPQGAMNHSLPSLDNIINSFNEESPSAYDKDNQDIGNIGNQDIITYPNSEDLDPKSYIRK